MNQETIGQEGENAAVMSRMDVSDMAVKVCPIDPAELAQCDSCQ